MVRIQQREYFEQKVLELEELITGTYPALTTTSKINQGEELVSTQAEMRIPGYEGLFFVEWVHYINEEDPDFTYECVVFTAEGEELELVYSNNVVKATTECIRGVQEMLLSVSDWIDGIFLND